MNRQGGLSARADRGEENLQRVLLEHEGVRFDARGRFDLDRHRWRPRA